MPRASAMVATMGNPSGMAATARAMLASIIRTISLPMATPAKPTRPAKSTVTLTNCAVSRSSLRSSGEASGSAAMTRLVICPSSVAMPVATTTPRPVPRVMAVPLCTIEVRSAMTAFRATGATVLSTGIDSPVRVDSSQQRFAASTRRRSAVTMSPLSSRTMSPGTSASAGTMFTLPPRLTREEREPSQRSASMDLTARSSVTNPMSVLMPSTSRIATASVQSPKAPARAAAPPSSSTTGPLT